MTEILGEKLVGGTLVGGPYPMIGAAPSLCPLFDHGTIVGDSCWMYHCGCCFQSICCICWCILLDLLGILGKPGTNHSFVVLLPSWSYFFDKLGVLNFLHIVSVKFLSSGRRPQMGKAWCGPPLSDPAVLHGIGAFLLEDKSLALIFSGVLCTWVVWNVASNPLYAGNNARSVAVLVVDAVIAMVWLVGIFCWDLSGLIVATRHATFIGPFGSSFLLTFLLCICCDLFTRKPCFQENAFGKISFAMILLPTKAYVGAGNLPVDGYV